MPFENATPRPWTKCHVFGSSNVELHGKQGPITVCPAIAHSKDDGDLIFTAVNAFEALADSLEEILNYQGGADSALEDEYVMDRAEAALKLARSET